MDYSTKIIYALAYGVANSIILTPIFIIVRKFLYMPTQNRKLFDYARKNNHILTGKLIKQYDVKNQQDNWNNQAIGIYEFEYNGKKFRKKFMGYSNFPSTQDFYYVKNPKKVCNQDELFLSVKSPWIFSFLIISIISFIIFYIML